MVCSLLYSIINQQHERDRTADNRIQQRTHHGYSYILREFKRDWRLLCPHKRLLSYWCVMSLPHQPESNNLSVVSYAVTLFLRHNSHNVLQRPIRLTYYSITPLMSCT